MTGIPFLRRRTGRTAPVTSRPTERRRPAERGLAVDDRGRLTLHGVELAGLVTGHGSPLHVVDAARLDANADAALEPLTARGVGMDVFSSYKTNPVPAVLDRLHRRGVGAEAISAYELWLALELGVDPERIIYNGPAKSDESLDRAVEVGVGLVNANSFDDLRRMDRAARRGGRPLRSGIRVSMPHMWGGQFGIELEAPELRDAIRFGVQSDHLEFVGLHTHSGFALRTCADVERHLGAVIAAARRLADETGWWPDVVDLGGSLACASDRLADGTPVLSLATASEIAASEFAAAAEADGRPCPTLVGEPGRALTADTQMLLTTVLDRRPVGHAHGDGHGDGDAVEIVVDVGVELAEPLTSSHHDVFLAGSPGGTDAEHRAPDRRGALVRHRVIGPHPRRRDVVADDVWLPPVDVGDVIVVMDTGAYFVPFSTATSHPRPAIVMVEPADGTLPATVSVIRRAEDVEHRLALDGRSLGR